MIDKVIIANVIEAILFISTLLINLIINRRKETICWVILNFIEMFVYILLGVEQGIMACLYASIKLSITYLLHRKEEKIIQSKLEVLILGIPYLVIGFINWNNGGWISILAGLCNFTNSSLYVIKSEKNRFIVDGFTQLYYAIYDFIYGNMIGGLKNLMELTTKIINLIRVIKYGEGAYYKIMRDSM